VDPNASRPSVEPSYTAEVHPNVPDQTVVQERSSAPNDTHQTPADGSQIVSGAEESRPDGASIIEGLESTPEELSQAATKIGAVYRGKKAREEVAAKKAAIEATKNDSQA